MNFRHHQSRHDPEINLIPLIDVLLVILIFLAASTTFTQQRQLEVALPEAQAEDLQTSTTLELAISRDGLFALNGQLVDAQTDARLAESLRKAHTEHPDAALRINADAQSTHAAVVRALEAARLAQITRIHFLTQARP